MTHPLSQFVLPTVAGVYDCIEDLQEKSWKKTWTPKKSGNTWTPKKLRRLAYFAMNTLTYGNANIQTRGFDQNYWPTSVIGVGHTAHNTFDANGNITRNQFNAATSWGTIYTYDDHNRLASGDFSDPCQGGGSSRVNPLLKIGCAYYNTQWLCDRTANCTRQKGTTNGPWINYSYEPSRHRIDAITDQNAVLRDRTTDLNCNTLSLFPVSESTQQLLSYDARNRLTQVNPTAG